MLRALFLVVLTGVCVSAMVERHPHRLKRTEGHCVEIDITESFGAGTTFTDSTEFLWDMGDRKTEKGLVIKHCYDSAGKYRVRMDTRSMKTGLVSKNEIEVDIEVE
jgi:PKD domain